MTARRGDTTPAHRASKASTDAPAAAPFAREPRRRRAPAPSARAGARRALRGVVQLALFGSTARDAAAADSEIEVLAAFDGAAELATVTALRERLRSCVERDAVRADRGSSLYLEDMLRFCDRVIACRGALDMPALRADALRSDALPRNLEPTGEAASRVPDDVRAAHSDIPWRLVVATRKRLIQGDLGIDDDTVWCIVSKDVPALRVRRWGLLHAR